MWRDASQFDRSIDEAEAGSRPFQSINLALEDVHAHPSQPIPPPLEADLADLVLEDPDGEPSSSLVITILDPYSGAVFREHNDVEISFTVEGLRRRIGAMEPRAVVSTVCRCSGCRRDGWRMGDEADITREITVALPLLCSVEKTCEMTVELASIPNGLYQVAVSIDFGDGRGQEGKSWSTFEVDVDVELQRVVEEDDIEGHAGRVGRQEEFSEEDLRAVARCEANGLTARRAPARIFDGFTYNGEVDLLEIRAEEFGDLVTGMVLVEAAQTFQGDAKELQYPSHAHRLPYAVRQKVRHVVEDFSEMGGEVAPMERETKQRDGILKGLDDAREQDLVLISDVDEIVKRDTMLLLRVCQDFWAVNGLFVGGTGQRMCS